MSSGKARIISPMARGNGAYVVHRLLERQIAGYSVSGYDPYWTLFPPLLPAVVQCNKADLIHSTPDYAVFLSSKSVPLVVTFHNYVLDPWMKPYSSKLQRIHYTTDLKLWTRLAVKRSQMITAVSHFTANCAIKHLNISKPIRVIYNGIDTDHFSPATQNMNASKGIKVFFSGNLIRRKGAQWLPGIAERLQNNIQVFYTQGLRTKLSFPAKPNLHSIGSVPFQDMPNRYREMDILLMPTVREGYGLAVAEAMACGLPVVASNCSSIPELIDDGKGGFLCPVGDAAAFAEKINILADSPRLRREMGQYNRAKVEKIFTLRKMVNNYQQLFDEALST